MTTMSPAAILQELESRTPQKKTGKGRRLITQDKKPNPVLVGVLRLLVIGIVFGGWELGAKLGAVNVFFWSSPSLILAKAVQQFGAGTLIDDLVFTLTSAVLGFLLGTILGTALGMSFWWSNTYGKTVEPFVVMFEAIPKLALAPIVVLVLGIGIESKIAMATGMVMAVQALNAAAGVRTVDRDVVRMLNSLGASRGKIFRSVVIPSTLPWIISGLRVTIGLALAGAIVGEFIGSDKGLGRLIVYAGSVYDIALIWVGVFVLALLSIALYLIVGFAERRLSHSIAATR
jgi:NitT/TauT family transport system permease protein